MGLFGKIKNILFEEEDEVEEMPVYTKEQVQEVDMPTFEKRSVPFMDEPIQTSDDSHFNNIKRDIDLSYDERDIFNEENDNIRSSKEKEEDQQVESDLDIPLRKNEKQSPFLAFDEDEFDRLNSRLNNNESRSKKTVKSVSEPQNLARKANNNFSSTTTNIDRKNNPDRYKINVGTTATGKKPFTPSPVISPVYGILDKNYTKDDIVDKKDGIKREKIVRTIIRKEENKDEQKEESVQILKVDIDSVRKKAYGELEFLEKNASLNKENTLNDNSQIIQDNLEEDNIIDAHSEIKEPSIEEQLNDRDFAITNVIDVSENLDEIEKIVDDAILKNNVNNDTKKTEQYKKPQILDDLEKTSTLQILDDIEKELNSIKPISNDESIKEGEELKVRLERNDTLENDLFNLIDSMYEEGEEEEDD